MIAFAVWATVIVAWIVAVTVVPVTPREACDLAGGDWNEAWARCYP